MPEHIMTRSDVTAEAMQFEGTQRNVDEIQEWINEYNPEFSVLWNGNDEYVSKDGPKIEAEPGFLELCRNRGVFVKPDFDILPGDWIVKSSRDTFYMVKNDDFHEIWVVMH